MAIRSGFFNSVSGDRKYDAGKFAEYFASFIGNGVFPNPASGLQVMAQTIPDMTVIVQPGKAWINGYILINDDDYILQLDPADGVLNRIDRIVARYDVADREIRLEVKKGTFSSSPVAPALQRDADAYELALADIAVNAGAILVTQANITDLRLNTALCGIVHGTVDQVDTTTLFDQYLSWYQQTTEQAEEDLQDTLTQLETDFNTWFATIQDVLDGDTAGNLLNLINANKSVVDSHLADLTSQEVGKGADIIGLPDPNNLFTATNVGGAMQELFTNVSNGKSLVGGAITDVDDSVVIPTDPTFQDLADGIGQISTGKKWASGSFVKNSNSSHTISGLPFKPSMGFVWGIRGTIVYRFSFHEPSETLGGTKRLSDLAIFKEGTTLKSISQFNDALVPTNNGFTITNTMINGVTMNYIMIE